MHDEYFEVLVWALFYLVIQDDAVLLFYFFFHLLAMKREFW